MRRILCSSSLSGSGVTSLVKGLRVLMSFSDLVSLDVLACMDPLDRVVFVGA